MAIWFCIPSARPAVKANPVLQKWRARGYKIALWRDTEAEAPICDLLLIGSYPGYAAAVNALTKEVLARDLDCQWIVTGGDDTEPDPGKSPAEIAAECGAHFRGTLGVMQPTGDRFAKGSIDRIAGSPWLGREWCERANGGAGPFWPEFTHMFGDECLQRSAIKAGVFWQRRDLVHLHRHFMRESESLTSESKRNVPPSHLVKWNSNQHWAAMRAVFDRLSSMSFAPCIQFAPAKERGAVA